ncbi:MAG: hypothetical protein ACPIOQ_82795, partial [Promethearchaeia archaeon]
MHFQQALLLCLSSATCHLVKRHPLGKDDGFDRKTITQFSCKNKDNPQRHVRRGGQRVDKRARCGWGSRAEMAGSRSRSPRGTSPRAKARS